MIVPPLFRKDCDFEPFLEFYPDILKYSRGLCCTKEDAEDLTQIAFVSAWRSDYGEIKTRILPWLKNITYRRWVDAIRKGNRSL